MGDSKMDEMNDDNISRILEQIRKQKSNDQNNERMLFELIDKMCSPPDIFRDPNVFSIPHSNGKSTVEDIMKIFKDDSPD